MPVCSRKEANLTQWPHVGIELSDTSTFKTGILLASLPDTWLYRVSARVGWLNSIILWLGDTARWFATCISKWWYLRDLFPRYILHFAGELSTQERRNILFNNTTTTASKIAWEICSEIHFTCCWDVKHPTKEKHSLQQHHHHHI